MQNTAKIQIEAEEPIRESDRDIECLTTSDVVKIIRDALTLRGIAVELADERARNIACALQGTVIL